MRQYVHLIIMGLIIAAQLFYGLWERGRAKEALQIHKDSIAVLEPIVVSLRSLDASRTAEAASRDSAYADSTRAWRLRLQGNKDVVVVSEAVYDSLDAEIRRGLDAEKQRQMDELRASKDASIAALQNGLITESRRADAAEARAIMWEGVAQIRLEGWDTERDLRIQESLRADTAEKLLNPNFAIRLWDAGPEVAFGVGLGYLLFGR